MERNRHRPQKARSQQDSRFQHFYEGSRPEKESHVITHDNVLSSYSLNHELRCSHPKIQLLAEIYAEDWQNPADLCKLEQKDRARIRTWHRGKFQLTKQGESESFRDKVQ